MRAVVVSEPGKYSLETVPDPTPRSDQVVVAVRGCGICGTDRHIVDEGMPVVRYPVIPGHEPWGEVVALGTDVESLSVGDLVGIDPSLPCGACNRCLRGQTNLCRRWGAVGITADGAWSEFVAVGARSAVALGDEYPLDLASIAQPVACAMRGLDRLRPEPDRAALLYGGGAIGLTFAVLLELYGVGPITVVETNAERREVGRRVTGARMIAPEELGDDEEFEYVVDATGAPAAIEAALAHTAFGGTFLVFGIAPPDATVPLSPFRAYQREITIVGSIGLLRTFGPALDAVARHPERFRPLITHTFGLDGFQHAIEALSDSSAIKVMIASGS